MVVIGKLDEITEKFQLIYQKNAPNLKPAQNNNNAMGGQERSLNLIRGILRVTEALSRNPEAALNTNFQQWLNSCVLDNAEVPAIREMYEKIVSSQHFMV